MKPTMVCGAAAVLVMAALAWGRTPMNIPVMMVDADQLVARLAEYRQGHLGDAGAFYRLGRTHYVVATLKLAKVGVVASRKGAGEYALPESPEVVVDTHETGRPSRAVMGGVEVVSQGDKLDLDNTGLAWAGGIAAREMTAEAAAGHLRAAVSNLRLAVLKDGKVARYHLALACALDDAAAGKLADVPETEDIAAAGLDVRRVGDNGEIVEKEREKARAGAPAATPAVLRRQAAAEYLKAYELAIKEESKLAVLPRFGIHALVSYEAGKRYLQMVDLAPVVVDSPGTQPAEGDMREIAKIEEIKKNVARFETLSAPNQY